MIDGSHIAALGLDLAAGLLAVYWGAGLCRALSAAVSVPSLQRGVDSARARPTERSVCIIVPAHNEEGAIGPMIRAVRAQTHGRWSAVLCLDRCTDGTRGAAIAAIDGDGRFAIEDIGTCPQGWAGKVNAAALGAASASARSADLLLFLDADTVMDPECLAGSAALMRDRGLDLLSLLSTLSSRRWFELVVQPTAGMELVRQYPMARANRVTGRRAFANGQFMLFERGAYDAVGGHAAVHGELLEDLALARAIARAGRPGGIFFARGLLACRMYESYDAFCAGWKRIYTESTQRKVRRLRQAALCNLVGGGFLPPCAAANLVLSAFLVDEAGLTGRLGVLGLWLSGAGIVLWLTVMTIGYRISRVPLWAIPASVLGACLVGRILLAAIRDLKGGIPTTWGGRSYTRVAR